MRTARNRCKYRCLKEFLLLKIKIDMYLKLIFVIIMTEVNKTELNNKDSNNKERNKFDIDWEVRHAFDEWVRNTPGMSYNEHISMSMWKLVVKGYPLDYVWNNVAKWNETNSGEGIHIHFNDSERESLNIIETRRDSRSGKWREQMEEARLTKGTAHKSDLENINEFPPEIKLGVIGPHGMGVIDNNGDKLVYRSILGHLDEIISLQSYNMEKTAGQR